jgi:hypothetical protein
MRISCVPFFAQTLQRLDSLRFDLMLHKMENIGFEQSAINLMSSYLQDRKQKVIWNNVSSDIQGVQIGVPQGSLNGPLAYHIATNDLFEVPKGYIVGYADDVCTYYTARSTDDLRGQMQADLDAIAQWCDKNFIKINASKSHFVFISKGMGTGDQPILLTLATR